MSTHHHTHDHCCDHQHLKENTYIMRVLVSVVLIIGALFVLRPTIVEQMYLRTASYAMYGMHEQIIRMCQKIIFFDPGYVKAWTSLGIVYADEGENDKAVGALTRVLELEPEEHGAASFMLGKIYYEANNYQKAIIYFERIRSLGKDVAAALDADILSYRHGPQAMRHLHGYQKMLGYLADAYEKTGNPSEAAQIRLQLLAAQEKNRIF